MTVVYCDRSERYLLTIYYVISSIYGLYVGNETHLFIDSSKNKGIFDISTKMHNNIVTTWVVRTILISSSDSVFHQFQQF